MSDELRRPSELTADQLTQLLDTIRCAAELRFEKRHSPFDVLLSAWEMIDTFTYVHADVAWPDNARDLKIKLNELKIKHDQLEAEYEGLFTLHNDLHHRSEGYAAELTAIGAGVIDVIEEMDRRPRMTKAEIRERLAALLEPDNALLEPDNQD